jgi:Mrp family chromosome partitioning ATPase
MTPARVVQLLAEEETRLIENLFLANGTKRLTITFTAPERHAGCSWLVSLIAPVLAKRIGGSVCVVDANLYWPSMHTLFGIPNERGLLQAAMQPEQPIRGFAVRLSDGNLYVVPSGGPLTDSKAVLASENLKLRIAELAREFDYVLIDTPAMKSCADSGIVGQLTDGVVLVLGANSGKRDTAMNTRLMLEAAKIPILGAVLNRRTFPIPDNIYQYL